MGVADTTVAKRRERKTELVDNFMTDKNECGGMTSRWGGTNGTGRPSDDRMCEGERVWGEERSSSLIV